jgi:methionine-rich copper-binding protein CopC
MKAQLNIVFLNRVMIPIVAAVFVLAAPNARAHARLTHSLPSADAALAQSPAQIELWFNELLDNGDFNTISVFAASEARSQTRTELTAGKAQVDGKEHTHLTIGLKPLPPGQYVVEWRVLSLDGHTAPGRLKFTVTASK